MREILNRVLPRRGRRCAWLAGILLLAAALLPVIGGEPPADPALDLYYAANGLYNRKLYELSAQEYRSFLAKYPGHEKALHAQLGLALSLHSLGKFAEAGPLLAKLAANPKAPEADQVQLLWAQALLNLQRLPEAETAFAQAARNQSTAAAGLAGLVEVLFQRQKWAELIARCDELGKADPKGPFTSRARFQGALARYELKQYAAAAPILAEFVKAAGNDPLAQRAVFLLAECQRETGDPKNAADNYEIAARKIKGDLAADALFRLGFLRFNQQDFNAATRDFEQLRREHPDNPLAPQSGIYLGRIHLEKSNFSKAEPLLRGLLSDPGVGPDAALWLARGLNRQKKSREASATLDRASERFAKDPRLPLLLHESGRILLDQEKFAEASKTFGRIVTAFAASPQAPEALRLQALCLHRDRQFKASLELCRGYLGRYSTNAGAAAVSFLEAENRFFLEQRDEALAAYRKFLGAWPNDRNAEAAHWRIGQLLYQQEQWKDALRELEPLARQQNASPFLAQAGFFAGDCCFRADQWDAAIEYFDRYLAEHPREANADLALLKVGLAWSRKNNGDRAQAMFQKLASEHPQSSHVPQALVELGRLLYEAGQYAEAAKPLRELAQRFSDSTWRPQADYYLGWIALAEKKEAEAARQFARVADQHPKHPLAADARLQQGLALSQNNDFRNTQAALEKFVQSYPSDSRMDQAVFYLGIALARQKQWDRALEQFRKLEQWPQSVLRDRALYESAWCEKGANRPTDAEKRYAALLSAFPKSDLAQPAAFELAELEFEARKYDAAARRLADLCANVKDQELRARAQYRLGWSQFKLEKWSEAASAFEALLAGSPLPNLVAQAAFQAGEARLKSREYAPAARHFSQAASVKGELQEQALLRRGECLALAEKWPESEQCYESLVRQFPKGDWLRQARYGIGWARENQKRHAEAVQAYRQVLEGGERDETGARSQFQIGECLLAQGQWDEAIREFIKVEVNYAFPGWSSKALVEIGLALERKGAKAEALERYKEVINKYPETDAATVARERIKKLE